MSLRPLGAVTFSAHGSRLRAVDTTDGAIVLVKHPRDPGAAMREASLLARLDGLAVPRLRDLRNGFLVLEHLDGETLEQRLRLAGGRLREDVLWPLLAAAVAAVQRLHEAGVIHRDLKPANILLQPGDRVALLDFGAAAVIGEHTAGATATLLTPGYAAPEQYRQVGPEGPWTDVYALAAVGVRALTGALPPAAPLRSAGAADLDLSGISAAMQPVLYRALALEPRARTQTAADFRRALLAGDGGSAETPAAGEWDSDDGPPTLLVVREPGAPVPPPRDPSPPSALRTRRRGAGRVLLVVMLLLASVVVAGWLGRPWYERHVKRDWLVDAAGSGDTDRITDALTRAGEGAVLRVRPGTYSESLVVDRPVTLAADDPENLPVIAPASGPCLTLRGDGVTIQGLDLRAPAVAEGIEAQPCVSIGGGAVRLEGSRVHGAGAPALLLRDGAVAQVVGNDIRSSAAGIIVTAGARPAIERNTLAEIAGPALLVRGGAAPVVEGNVFEAGGPVVFAEAATGAFRGNTLRESRATAIEIGGGADPEIAGNGIEHPAQSGVYVYGGSRGVVHDNRIDASELSGIVVDGGAPRLTGNQITGSAEHGILIINASGGGIDGNTVRNSQRNGIVIDTDAKIELGSNTLQGNATPQLVDLRRR